MLGWADIWQQTGNVPTKSLLGSLQGYFGDVCEISAQILTIWALHDVIFSQISKCIIFKYRPQNHIIFV